MTIRDDGDGRAMVGAVAGALVPNVLSLVFVLTGQMPLPALLVLMTLEAIVVGALWLQFRRPETAAQGWGASIFVAVIAGVILGMRAVEDTDWSWGTLGTILANLLVFVATQWWRRRHGATTLFTGGDTAARFLLILFGVVVLLSWVDTIGDLPHGWASQQHGTATMSWFGWQVNRYIDGSGMRPMTAAALALFFVKALNDVLLAVRATWLERDRPVSAPSSDGGPAR